MSDRSGRRSRHRRSKARRMVRKRSEQWWFDLYCRAHEGEMAVRRGDWISLEDFREQLAREERNA